jgi:RHS repeat-associated protein
MQSDFTYNYYSQTNKPQNLNDGLDYQYDEIGNLTADPSQNVTSIDWTPYGKVREVTKGDGTTVSFKYDGAGNRIEKSTTSGGTTTTMHYIRDASGNVMAMYANDTLQSQPIYGSSRLGMYKGGNRTGERNLGNKHYELSNHLGNVLAVVTDNINMKNDSTTATVVSASDYYPFGSNMPGRTFSSEDYKYGFNGKEKDQNGEFGNTHYDYGFRIYNPEIGKFLSVDPLSPKYPFYSPYQYAGNTPIKFIDIDGLEPTEAILHWKVAPKLREAQGNPAKQIFYQTSGLGGSGKYVQKQYVYEDYSEGTSKFFWYNDMENQWIIFDPNNLVEPKEVERVALTGIGIAAVGVGGGVLIESGWGYVLRPYIHTNLKDIIGRSAMDALNQTIVNDGDVGEVDWINVAASALVKNIHFKNAIASLADYNFNDGYNSDKTKNEIATEFIIRWAADEVFKGKDNNPLENKTSDWYGSWAKDLVKKYARNQTKEVIKQATGSSDTGTPEN